MTRTDATVRLTGIGLLAQEEGRGGWDVLKQELRSAGQERLFGYFADTSEKRPTTHKLLGSEDLLAIRAAERAMEDAFGGIETSGRTWACVTFGTSKLTRESALALPFARYRDHDQRPDTAAFRRAINACEVHVDPLGLVRRLDNAVNWWICKTYGIGDTNLHIGQSLNPDLWALVTAIDLLSCGAADAVIVGGGQSIDQSAVHLTGTNDRSDERDTSVGGGAVFFVLEQDAPGRSRSGYAQLHLDLEGSPLDAHPVLSDRLGTPALTAAVEVIRHSLLASDHPESASKVGPIRIKGLPL